MIDIEVDVDSQGPFFDGRTQLAISQYCAATSEEVAQTGFDDVQRAMRSTFQHPTGHYYSRVHVEDKGLTNLITDGGVIYGPWLEGTGSRNRTTRFKGYFNFRKTAQALNGKSEFIAERVIKRYEGRF